LLDFGFTLLVFTFIGKDFLIFIFVERIARLIEANKSLSIFSVVNSTILSFTIPISLVIGCSLLELYADTRFTLIPYIKDFSIILL